MTSDWADEIVRDLAADGADVDRGSAECAAAAIVDGFGVEKARAYLTDDQRYAGDQDEPIEYAPEDAGILAAAATNCFDMRGVFVQTLTALGLDSAQASCLADGYESAGWEELLALSYAGQDEAVQQLLEVDELTADCGLGR